MCKCSTVSDSDNNVTEDEERHSSTPNMSSSNCSDSDNSINLK